MDMIKYICRRAQCGIRNLATQTKLNRQNLYKILTDKTTPKFDTALSIIEGHGFKLFIEHVNHINQ